MSTTAVKHFAVKDSVVDALQWNGNETSYNEIKYWLGSSVDRVDGVLLYRVERVMEPVEVGNYLVNVNGELFSMTPEELFLDYVRVQT